MKKILLVVLLMTLLTGCNAKTVEVVEITRMVEVTRLVEITSTPIPPTSTPEITSTPTFAVFTTDQAINALKAAGLEFENYYTMTKDDYGLAPMVATSAIRFIIPSLCSDCGGRLYSFNSQEDLDLTRRYYVEFGRQSAALFSWTFSNQNILIQISGDLSEEKARQYEAVINSLAQ